MPTASFFDGKLSKRGVPYPLLTLLDQTLEAVLHRDLGDGRESIDKEDAVEVVDLVLQHPPHELVGLDLEPLARGGGLGLGLLALLADLGAQRLALLVDEVNVRLPLGNLRLSLLNARRRCSRLSIMDEPVPLGSTLSAVPVSSAPCTALSSDLEARSRCSRSGTGPRASRRRR